MNNNMKIQKISNFAISRAKQFSKSFIRQKTPVQTILPIVSVPLVVYSLKSDRKNMNNIIKI